MQIELIETQRLRGERINLKHWENWLKMGYNPTVMATLGGTWSKDKAYRKMEFNCDLWQRYGHGLWIFYDRKTNLFVGRGGIRKAKVNGDEEVELNYALMPEFWGKELALEIGKKALSVAFNKFNYSSVVCEALINNKSSERVMQKIGFIFEKNIVKANQPHILYRYKNPKY